MNFREFFWPMLEPETDVEAAQLAAQQRLDIAFIRSGTIRRDVDVLIEEARRLSDAETDRRKSAETRATAYLTAVGALATVFLALAPAALDPKEGLVQPLLTLGLFLVAGAYLFFAGRWAFRSLEVSKSARLDAVDLIDLWRKAGTKQELAKGMLVCVRTERPWINYKITSVKMAHAFLVRAFCVLVVAVLAKFAWVPLAKFILVILT